MMLNKTNHVPLYFQLKEIIRQQIVSGQLAPGMAIPSEMTLVTQYRVSRQTVRQALAELIQEGLIYRKHGKGTFVEPVERKQLHYQELKEAAEQAYKHFFTLYQNGVLTPLEAPIFQALTQALQESPVS